MATVTKHKLKEDFEETLIGALLVNLLPLSDMLKENKFLKVCFNLLALNNGIYRLRSEIYLIARKCHRPRLRFLKQI